ncbi:MAG: tetratricopeptide repeat protein [Nitrospirota bacterium]
MEEKIYALIREAESLRERAAYKEALKRFRRALSLSKRHHHLDGVLDATLAIADISRMTGDFDLAIRHYEEALESSEALGNRLTAADCMVGMGLSLRAIGMWKEAVRFITTARKTYRKENDTKGVAFSLWAEAGALRVAGDIGKAIERFEESRDLFSSLCFDSGMAYALCGLGGTHRIAGKSEVSLSYYRQANSMFRAQKDTFGAAYSHCGIGNAYRMLHRYADAMRHFSKATRLYEKIGDRVSYSYTLWSIATLYKMKGESAKARSSIQKALRNFRMTKDPRGIVYCDLALGELLFMEGKTGAARKKMLAAAASAARHGFKLEQCHADALLAVVDGNGMRSPKTPCYRKREVELPAPSIPFNIP